MQVPLAKALEQLRDELRKAILDSQDKEIVFTPTEIELELGITFSAETKAGAGFKILTLLDVSGEGKASRESQHKIRLSLAVADKFGDPIKVRSTKIPRGL